MAGPPDPLLLQEIVLFNVIYYMGRRRRQNLRHMKINTFEIGCDADGKRYMHQVKKEFDKNRRENDLSNNNAARVYEIPGKLNLKT